MFKCLIMSRVLYRGKAESFECSEGDVKQCVHRVAKSTGFPPPCLSALRPGLCVLLVDVITSIYVGLLFMPTLGRKITCSLM